MSLTARSVEAMSSTPSGAPFKDHYVATLSSSLISLINAGSHDSHPNEADIDRFKKDVDEFCSATRKQANRYQRDLEGLIGRHGSADQARRRDGQKVASKTEVEG